MTAEVAVANATAVALAADSAVTIGRQKIYNSALKVFSLSKVAPVGVMIYGNALLMDVPWEVLIKTFREEIGNKTLPSLTDYSTQFISYVASHTEFFPSESQASWMERNVIGYYSLIREEFLKAVRSQLGHTQTDIPDEKAFELFSNTIHEHHKELSGTEFVDSFDAALENKFRDKHVSKFKQIRDNIFEKLPISNSLARKLNDIAAFIHSRKIYSQNLSGVVVAGYGQEEIYPSICSFDVEGIVDNILKYASNKKKSGLIKGGSDCLIIPFAQDDMVATFMNGVNPELLNFLSSYLTEAFRRLPDIFFIDGVTKQQRKIAVNSAAKLLDSFFQDLTQHLHEVHISPVLNMVTVLPKDELAEMAESLVNLTAFKRRMSDSVETVGGPIDVAIISKGDGLVWVKRKHYFPPELNQHFFRNYFRGVDDGKAREN
jgi:hypothetical protein